MDAPRGVCHVHEERVEHPRRAYRISGGTIELGIGIGVGVGVGATGMKRGSSILAAPIG